MKNSMGLVKLIILTPLFVVAVGCTLLIALLLFIEDQATTFIKSAINWDDGKSDNGVE